MKKKYILTSLLSLSIMNFSIAQDADNLIPNPSFEGTKGKLKNIKQINKAVDWFSPTGLRADLFSAAKPDLPISVPNNKYGREKPLEGDNYAGITAYSYNNRSARTYLLTPLTTKLKKGQKYCVKYNVSLADLSKYAINNLGAHLTKKAIDIEGKRDIIFTKKEVVIKTASNRIYEARYNWETVCGIFEAKGGEKFLIIGNFNESKDTKYKKLKKKKDFKGSQVPLAYYYIDQVSVEILSGDKTCTCETADEKEVEKVIYRKKSTSMDELSNAEKITNSTLYFDYLKSSLEAEAKASIDELAGMLIDNPSMKIKIEAHSTNDEVQKAKEVDFHEELAKRRIEKVLEYFQSHGLEEDRFEIETQDNLEPVDTSGTELAKAKNRRVTFVLIQ